MALATALVGEFCQVQAQTEFRQKEQRMMVTGGVILETNVSGFTSDAIRWSIWFTIIFLILLISLSLTLPSNT